MKPTHRPRKPNLLSRFREALNIVSIVSIRCLLIQSVIRSIVLRARTLLGFPATLGGIDIPTSFSSPSKRGALNVCGSTPYFHKRKKELNEKRLSL